jgi:hypothetical protein
MFVNIFSFAAAMALFGLASAGQCHATNALGKTWAPGQNNALCLSQGDGQWTFAMYVDMTVVPDLSGSSPLAGAVTGTLFMIYDNDCNMKSLYQQPSCGIPYYIEESFLADTLIISGLDAELGNPDFQFNYGNGLYSIGNNGCVCNDMSSGLEGAEGCRCAFPVDGIFTG